MFSPSWDAERESVCKFIGGHLISVKQTRLRDVTLLPQNRPRAESALTNTPGTSIPMHSTTSEGVQLTLNSSLMYSAHILFIKTSKMPGSGGDTIGGTKNMSLLFTTESSLCTLT